MSFHIKPETFRSSWLLFNTVECEQTVTLEVQITSKTGIITIRIDRAFKVDEFKLSSQCISLM